MPFTLVELRAEIERAPYAGKSDGDIAAMLNDKAGAESASIDVEWVEPWQLQAAVVASEYEAVTITDAERRMWSDLLRLPRIPVKNANIRGQVLAIWAAGTTTRSNLGNLQSRTGSRAEVLWGDGATVDFDEVLKARTA